MHSKGKTNTFSLSSSSAVHGTLFRLTRGGSTGYVLQIIKKKKKKIKLKKKKKVIINEGQSMQCKPRLPLITIVHGVRKHDSKTKYGYQRTLQIFKTASDYAR